MSAMRLLTREEFYSELSKNGFSETEQKTLEHTLWFHTESGKHFTVPHYAEGGIPDCILDEYLRAVDKLYTEGDSEDCGNKRYKISDKVTPNLTVVKKSRPSKL